jgi:hypothetical protein
MASQWRLCNTDQRARTWRGFLVRCDVRLLPAEITETSIDVMKDARLRQWLSSPQNPPVRYLVSRDLVRPQPSDASLQRQRQAILRWEPLRRILELQLPDGSFPGRTRSVTAQPTFWALALMHRCGLDVTDQPVARSIAYLTGRHLRKGAVSYLVGDSGVLPCYAGVVATTLIGMGALESELVGASQRWLIDHQRYDHKAARAGGEGVWPYRAPQNFGCWESVSCYHGVAAAIRAFAAVPPEARSPDVQRRLAESIAYLEAHRLYKKSTSGRPMFRHMTKPFLVGDYRSDLLDMLQGVADADPELVGQEWVRDAVEEMHALTDDGRVPLVHNYGRALIDPIPLEQIGKASRFLSYQWLRIRLTFGGTLDGSDSPAWVG